MDIRDTYNLNIYASENIKIGYVFLKMGQVEKGEKLFTEFKDFAENDASIYKHSSLALYYANKGETEKALEHLQLFSKEEKYFYWTVLFLPLEPPFGYIKNLPEFKSIMSTIESKFWNWHERVKISLEKKDLI